MPKFLLLIFYAFFSHPAFSQSTGELTLSEAINVASKESPLLQMARGRESEFSAKKTIARAGFLPVVKADLFKYFNQKYETMVLNGANFPLVSPQSAARVSLQMPLYNGFRNVNQYQSASLLEEASGKDRQWEEFVLARHIKEAFLRALAAVELARVSQENIITLEDHLSHTQARKKGGIATSYDVLRIEVQLDEVRTQKIEADDRVVVTRQELSRLIGTPSDDRKLVGELPDPSESFNVQALSSDKVERADLEAIKLNSESALHNKNSASNWLVPEIGLMAGYDWYNNANYSWAKSDQYKNAYGVGMYLTWNLFDGGASFGKSKEATAQLVQAEAKSRMEEQKIPVTLETLKRRYNYGTALFKTAISDIKKSEESVRQAKEGAAQGVRTVSEQLDAQLDLFRSKATKVNAQLLTAEALINLELTTGKDLSYAK